MTNLQRVVYGLIGLVLLAVAAAWLLGGFA